MDPDKIAKIKALITAWNEEAARYDALVKDLADAPLQQRFAGRAKQCRRCAADLRRILETACSA